MTPCAVDSTFIGDVPPLTVFAFDANGKLVMSVTSQHAKLDRNYELLVPVSNGSFTFIAWAGVNDNFTLGSFTPGTTTKQDVMLALKASGDTAPNLSGTKIWEGESNAVSLPDPNEYASYYEHTSINLREVTNRVKIIIEFDPKYTPLKKEEMALSIVSDNGTMLINGTIPPNLKDVTYPTVGFSESENAFSWDFALMDLVKEKKNNLIIDYLPTGERIFNGDLIKQLLLNTINGNINLACENDFVIKMVLTDYCETCETHFSVQISVNGWPVHSYETDL